MGLRETIVSRKSELAEVENQIKELALRAHDQRREIADLEYQLEKQEKNRLKNYTSCLIVTQLIDNGGCKNCKIEDKCSYLGKGKKFRL